MDDLSAILPRRAGCAIGLESSLQLRQNYVSDLAATGCSALVCSPRHALIDCSFILQGLLITGGAVLTWRRWSGLARVGMSLLIVCGVGVIVVGLVPEECQWRAASHRGGITFSNEASPQTHLGYPKHDPEGRGSGNSRTGATSKTVRGDFGQVEIESPRDRNSSFEPKIVAQSRYSDCVKLTCYAL